MKKLLSLILVAVMALSLCACGESGKADAQPKGLQAGFGREIVMPENVVGVHINGTDTAGRE